MVDPRDVALAAVRSSFRSDVYRLFTRLVNNLAEAGEEEEAVQRAQRAFRRGFEQSTQAFETACATIDEMLPAAEER